MFLYIILMCSFSYEDIAQSYYHYSLGEKHFLEGKFQLALEEYDIAKNFNNNSLELESKIAQTYKELNNKTKAYEILKAIYEQNKTIVEANQVYMEYLIEDNFFNEALEVANSTLKIDPKNRTANLYKAVILIEKNKSNEALKLLNSYVEIDTEDALAYYYIGNIYLSMDENYLAEQNFLKSLYVDPSYKPSILSLVNIYMANESYKNLEKLNKLKNLVQSDDKIVQNKLISVYLEMAQDSSNKKTSLKYMKKALDELGQIEADNPEDANVKLKIALVYLSLNDYSKAKKIFYELIKKNPSNDKAKYYMANVLYLEKHYQEAVNTYLEINSSSYLFEEAINNASKILTDQSKVLEAIDIVEKALVKQNDSVKLHDLYASLLENVGKSKKAIELLERSITLYPDNEQLLYHLASLYYDNNDSKKSLSLMKKVLLINPDNPFALNFVAYDLLESGVNLEEAQKHVSKALSYLPEDPYINDTMGWYYFKKGEYITSIFYLEKASSILKAKGIEESEIAKHLAKTYEALGYMEKSKNTYDLISDSKVGNRNTHNESERLPASFK